MRCETQFPTRWWTKQNSFDQSPTWKHLSIIVIRYFSSDTIMVAVEWNFLKQISGWTEGG